MMHFACRLTNPQAAETGMQRPNTDQIWPRIGSWKTYGACNEAHDDRMTVIQERSYQSEVTSSKAPA